MRLSKRLRTLVATAALIAVGVAALPSRADAYWVWRGGVRVWVPAPVVVVPPPPVYYAPRRVYAPPVVYAPPPVYYAPRRVWIPPHYRGPYYVPGHWS